MTALLQVRGLSKSFGGLKAINNVDFDVEDKAIHGLIGPNGSGKSTLFNLVSCVYRAEAGEVHFDGRNITNIEPHEVAEAGIARTFQLLRMFTEMTVLENLMVGHHCHVSYSTFAGIFNIGRVAQEERQIRDEMMEILEFIGLSDFAGIPASELSVGQRRLLALGRAIAMKPKLLMLDEPAAGLAPPNVENLMSIMMQLKERYGLTVVVVEHILKVVMDTCDMVSVLDHGVRIATGTPEEIKDNPAVVEAYLGKEMDDEQVRQEIGVA